MLFLYCGSRHVSPVPLNSDLRRLVLVSVTFTNFFPTVVKSPRVPQHEFGSSSYGAALRGSFILPQLWGFADSLLDSLLRSQL